MIRLACTHCKNVLTIDDAFAGGVCRCQHCGTIQTVPARGADAAATGDALIGQPVGGLGGGPNGPAANRSRYPQTGRAAAAAAGTGLDDLANVVVSSGLSSGRLTRGGRPKPTLLPWFVAAGGVILALVGVVAYLATRPAGGPPPRTVPLPGDPGRPTGTPVSGRTPDVPEAPPTPSFCGVPLTGSTVVYLLDRGEATREILSPLKEAALNSALSLGAEKRFQIVFWSGESDATPYPESGTAFGSRESVADGKRALDDVNGFGQTDVKPALTTALADQPDEIVVATGKGWTLDDDWVKDVLAARGSSTCRIDTFSLNGNGNGDSTALRDLAAKTGGTYRDLSNAELRQFAP